MTGKGAVKPPSRREIAVQGAIGIGSALGIIFIALICQLLFLKHRRRRSGRAELGTWQEKMDLTDNSHNNAQGEVQPVPQVLASANNIVRRKPLPSYLHQEAGGTAMLQRGIVKPLDNGRDTQ